LSNYFFALIRNNFIVITFIVMDRSYQEYFDIFMLLGECRKNYRQAANTWMLF